MLCFSQDPLGVHPCVQKLCLVMVAENILPGGPQGADFIGAGTKGPKASATAGTGKAGAASVVAGR